MMIMLFIKKPKYSIIGAALIIIIILLPNPYREQIEEVHKTDPYAYTRIKIYKMGIEMFSNNFITGVGLGDFDQFTPKYNFPVKSVVGYYRVIPKQAHNSLLSLGD